MLLSAHVVSGVPREGTVAAARGSVRSSNDWLQWFVNAQNEHTPDRWLAGQAQCPTCRAQFSARDISFLAEPS
jgi:hypothetical protein